MARTSFRSLISTVLTVMLMPLALAHADASVSITSVSPGTTVRSGNQLSFIATAQNFNAAPVYSLTDSFPGSTISSNNINAAGSFGWIPSATEGGTHLITVSVSDGTGATASASLSVVVEGPPTLTIRSLSPGSSVGPRQTVFFSAAATGLSNPSFYATDSFTGSSMMSNAVNSAGGFSWTPTAADAGTHTITITATDPDGRSATAAQTITVTPGPSITLSPAFTSTTTVPGTAVSFSASAANMSTPVFSVSDALFGSSMNNNAINPATGAFSWTPRTNELGTHVITVTAQDLAGNATSTSVTIVVASTPTAPLTIAATTTPSTIVPSATSTQTQQTQRFKFTRTLSLGSRGIDVTALQLMLKSLGFFSGDTSLYFGAMTRASVRAFQKAHGIDTTGIVGPMTRAALGAGQ